MWDILLKRYWQVSTFRESPANTPYSIPLLVIVALLFFLLMVWQWFMVDIKGQFKLATSVATGISLIGTYFIFTFLILKMNRKANRVVKTLTSLLASHLIVHLFAIPLLLVTPILASANVTNTAALLLAIIYLLLTLVLTAWQFLVTAHIYKHALETDTLTSVLASFGLLACNVLIVSFWR
ncbi:Uncharacterised protein [Legionella lansingensis]|uniref:Yip1 domain protein n=1 Tax=Legionella lansingensis TaxID=45067 RepID=A0A0W0VXK6_9GAMM|nr:hypothetical protein [Legionella lansingensis]KTD24762.1 hypothetical protein Llan_0324 [Legionella lansingensis]SNV48847.1 Uncharacterised protein [Legionella lansingensis]